MDKSSLARFEALLAAGQDNALLRLSLGQGYLEAGDERAARDHLERALAFDADYSAAWKFLGKAHEAAGDAEAAAEAYRRGIHVAEKLGDQQLVREMTVFLRRLTKRDDGTR